MLQRVSAIVCLAAVRSLAAWAVDIPIVNAGFEQVVLPCAAGRNCYASYTVTGWTSSACATFKPSTGPGGIFPAGIPEGVNVLALGFADSSNGITSQTLTASLQANTAYTLMFSIGSRADIAFAGGSVELLAGSTTLASDSSTTPPSGTFVTRRIVYSSTAANPALLGRKLEHSPHCQCWGTGGLRQTLA